MANNNPLRAELEIDAKGAFATINEFTNSVDGSMSSGGQKAGQSFVNAVKTQLAQLKNEKISIEIQSNQVSAQINTVKNNLKQLASEKAVLEVDSTKAQDQIDKLVKQLNIYATQKQNKGSTPELEVKTSNAIKQILDLEKAQDQIKSKTVTIDTKTAQGKQELSSLNNSISQLKGKSIELDIKTNQAKLSLGSLESQAGNSGKNAGTSFGRNFARVVTGVLGGISFNSLLGGVTNAVGAFNTVQRAQLNLSSAIGASNSRVAVQREVLSSSTSSIEEQAQAIGISTDKMYKNVTASQAISGSTSQLENQIKNQTRAFEDGQKAIEGSVRAKENDIKGLEKQKEAIDLQISSIERSIKGIDKETQAINNQIDAIKRITDEKTKALRVSLGGDNLDSEKNRLALQKNSLEIKKDQAKLDGDLVGAKFIDLEISALSDSISLNRNKLDNINLQIEALKQLDEPQIRQLENQKVGLSLKKQELEAQKELVNEQKAGIDNQIKYIQTAVNDLKTKIEANKIRFDADIEPAKRKLEDLRDAASQATAGGGGSQKVIDPKVEAQVSKRLSFIKENLLKDIDPKEVAAGIDVLFKKAQGLITEGDLSKAFGVLTASGANGSDAIKLLDGYIVTASNSSVGSKDLGNAVNNLAEAFQTASPVLGNLSGLQENYGTVIIPKGVQALEEMYRAQGILTDGEKLNAETLSEQEKAYVKSLGTQEVLNNRLGDNDTRWKSYNQTIGSGALEGAKMSAEMKRLEVSIGQGLQPTFTLALKTLEPLIKGFGEFAKNNPELVVGLTALGFALAGISIVIGILTPIFTAVGAVIGTSLIAPFAVLVLGVGALIAIGAFLFIHWEEIKIKASILGEYVGQAFNQLKNGVIAKWKELTEYVTNAFNSTKDYLFNTLNSIVGFGIDKFNQFRNGVVDAFSSIGNFARDTFNNILSFVQNINFSGAWNGLIEGAKGALNSIGDFFKNFNWRGLGNGLIDFIAGLLRGIGSGIPGADLVINPIINSLPRFASGGLVNGKNTIAMLNDGDGQEFVMNANAVRNYLPLLESLNSGYYNNQNTTNTNSNNSTQNFFQYSSGENQLGFSQRFLAS